MVVWCGGPCSPTISLDHICLPAAPPRPPGRCPVPTPARRDEASLACACVSASSGTSRARRVAPFSSLPCCFTRGECCVRARAKGREAARKTGVPSSFCFEPLSATNYAFPSTSTRETESERETPPPPNLPPLFLPAARALWCLSCLVAAAGSACRRVCAAALCRPWFTMRAVRDESVCPSQAGSGCYYSRVVLCAPHRLSARYVCRFRCGSRLSGSMQRPRMRTRPSQYIPVAGRQAAWPACQRRRTPVPSFAPSPSLTTRPPPPIPCVCSVLLCVYGCGASGRQASPFPPMVAA